MGKLKKDIFKRFDSIAVRICSIIILLIIPLNVVVLISTSNMISVALNQARVSLENVLNLYSQDMESRVSTGNYYLYSLSTSDMNFLKLMKQEDGSDYMLAKTRVASAMKSQLSASTTVDGYFFYSQKLDDAAVVMTNTTESYTDNELFSLKDRLKTWVMTENLNEYTSWTIIDVEDTSWLIRAQSRDDFYYGMLISLDELSTRFENNIDYENLTVHYNSVSDNENCINVRNVLLYDQLTIELSVRQSEIIWNLPKLQWLALFMACLYVLLIPVLIVILNHMMLRPLGRIRAALNFLKQGHRDYRINSHNEAKEFREINTSFNEMADHIEQLKIENYEKELQNSEMKLQNQEMKLKNQEMELYSQKMELRNLQLQIHPHFLLNIFNLMHSLAQVEDYQNIQKLALYLSDYFRYIFRSGHDLEKFGQELALIKEYLEISQIRYPVSYTAEYDIESEMYDVDIPPLLIHNFVENILKHALVPDRMIHILIAAHMEDEWAEFMIVDDGLGMDEKIVDAINDGTFAYESPDQRVHLGVANSAARVKSFFGDESSITVESMLNQGSCFTIRFPVKTAG